MSFIRFKPLYFSKVWGGRNLESKFSRDLPPGVPIGESWEISDRCGACSVAAGGVFDSMTLRSIIEQNPEYVMGRGWNPKKNFPVLVKWLDCSENLSVQVHPRSCRARSKGVEPKSENWYVAFARPGAKIYAGLRRGVDRREFGRLAAGNRLDKAVASFASRGGDSLFVPSGRIHALGGGNIILEIQENSDTTYRIYDWGRTGLDGKPRALHVEEAMKNIIFSDFEPAPLRFEGFSNAVLCRSRQFEIRKIKLPKGAKIGYAADCAPRIISVVEGALKSSCGGAVGLSENILIPFGEEAEFSAISACAILETVVFNACS